MATDTVIIYDRDWSRVTVELRIGNDSVPENNRVLDGITLTRDASRSYSSDGESIWYRRDRDPDHPDGNMTDWGEQPCYSLGETYTVELG